MFVAFLVGVFLIALGLLLLLFRLSGNVGVLTLEELSRRNDVVYLPISRKLAETLETWSKPCRIRVVTHGDAPVAEIIMTTKLSGADE